MLLINKNKKIKDILRRLKHFGMCGYWKTIHFRVIKYDVSNSNTSVDYSCSGISLYTHCTVKFWCNKLNGACHTKLY